MTNTEKISEDVEKILKGFDGMIGSKQKLKDLFSTSIQQAIAEERASVRGEIEKRLREVKPLYKFGDLIIDSEKMQAGTILGQQKALSDLLSSLDINNKE